MYITKYREQAKKVEIHREYEVIYYNIFVGQYRIAEYVSDTWVDRIVDGYNLLQKQEVDEINAKRAKEEYEAKLTLNGRQIMELCNTCKHREEEREGNDYCGVNHKWIPIDDCPCVHYEEDKALFDIATGLEII